MTVYVCITSALRTLGYTALMGAPRKVQPSFLLAIPRESLRYTALMGAPPKVQPMFVSYT